VRFCAKLRPDEVEFRVSAPIVVIGALSNIAPPVAPRLASGAALPTAPPNAAVPTVFTVSAKAPSTVFAKVISPPNWESRSAFAVSRTGSLYVCGPTVLTIPPLRSVVPGASVVRLARGMKLPTRPLNPVIPAVFTVSANAAGKGMPVSTVFAKVMSPPSCEVRTVSAVRNTRSL